MDLTGSRVSACRRLFGPVDHEQLHRDLQEELRLISEQESRRWNFNFQMETPLPGRFQWEEAAAGRSSALHRSLEGEATLSSRGGGGRGGGAAMEQKNCFSIPKECRVGPKMTPVQGKKRTKGRESTPKAAAQLRANTHITDFFPRKRRKVETKSATTPFQPFPAELAPSRILRCS